MTESISITTECPSVSQKSTLTYQLSKSGKLRIHDNTGAGLFSNEWVSLKSLEEILSKSSGFTSTEVKPFLKGRSINTSGFIMAALLHLAYIKRKDRKYVWVSKPKSAPTKKISKP